ncbi:hypothetical protein LCGC14_1197660, partial [marine sediment metagenome]
TTNPKITEKRKTPVDVIPLNQPINVSANKI